MTIRLNRKEVESLISAQLAGCSADTVFRFYDPIGEVELDRLEFEAPLEDVLAS